MCVETDSQAEHKHKLTVIVSTDDIFLGLLYVINCDRSLLVPYRSMLRTFIFYLSWSVFVPDSSFPSNPSWL